MRCFSKAVMSAALAGVAALSARPVPLSAQNFVLDLPMESPRATVTQVVGLSRVSIDYGRPGVNGRQIWGKLVPYDSVWRAGANVNTVIEFTSPVTVGGKLLPEGRYGLFMIPTITQWTVVLSKEANAWGAFSYRQSEDVVRLTVTPVASEMTERLEYSFDNPKADAVTITLRWDKLAVPFVASFNTTTVVMDSLQQQLRGLPRFYADAWRQAGAWALRGNQLPMASAWADSAVNRAANFANLQLKAAVLERQGDKAGAESLRARSFAVATEADMNAIGYQLLQEGKTDVAISVFLKNTKDHPQSWNVWDSLAEAYGVKGDKKLAITNYQKALAMVGDPTQKRRIEGAISALQKT